MPRYDRLYLFCLLAISSLMAHAQQQPSWEEAFANLSTADDIGNTDWEDTYEMLSQLEEDPIDINTASREELQRLPFLSDRQVEDIQAYLYQYGGMKSLAELAMITSLDYNTRILLTHFVCCKQPSTSAADDLGKMIRYGHHDFVATANVPMYERHGDQKGYLGYPYKHSVRYRFAYSNRLKIGLVGAQDAGEPFMANKNSMGYDFYSAYAEVHDLGCLKSAVAGRYRASFGMGLVVNNGFSIGKLSILSSLGNQTYGLRAHTSRSEASFLQGAAATVTITKGLDLSGFVSYRKKDATLAHGDSTITTILTSGYHRTENEMRKKNNISETVAGGNLSFFHKGYHIGTTATYTRYDKDLMPNTNLRYHRYAPTGRNFWNISADYGYTGHLITIHGETATGDCGALASINTVSLTPSSAFSVMAIHRFYGKKYHAMHARSFSEGGKVQNENGAYLGVKWLPTRQLKLTAYTDYAYFAAAKYQAQVSSQAWDNMVQAQYDTKRWSLTARYRLKMREQDNAEKAALITKTTHRARLTASLPIGACRCSTTADWTASDSEAKSYGWMVTQNISYAHRWLRINACVGYFDTDDSDSSVYGFDQGVLYSYSYKSFYGEGIRYACSVRADIGRQLMVIAHVSTVDYFDRDHISSGYQQIDHSSQTDLELQVRWRF